MTYEQEGAREDCSEELQQKRLEREIQWANPVIGSLQISEVGCDSSGLREILN